MEGRYRTPLGRARGLGAAGHGAGHWLSERVSSLALVPLVLWIAYAALQLLVALGSVVGALACLYALGHIAMLVASMPTL